MTLDAFYVRPYKKVKLALLFDVLSKWIV